MDTLTSLKVFRAIVEYGSFTQAAEHLNISVPMASKHLTHLENHLQAKLLQRSSRKQNLTDVGQQYYQQCCDALDTLENAKVKAQLGTVEPKGRLKITAPVWFASPFFAELFAKFQAQYPLIQLSLYLENRHIDLIAEGFDLALRITAKPQDNLIVKPLTKIPFHYVCSQSYLDTYGKPDSIDDLINHRGLVANYIPSTNLLSATHDSNNTLLLFELAKAGCGIVFSPKCLTTEAINKGELIELFASQIQPPTLYVAYMNRDYLNVRNRAFIDFLSTELA